jgi:hypothetical protein
MVRCYPKDQLNTTCKTRFGIWKLQKARVSFLMNTGKRLDRLFGAANPHNPTKPSRNDLRARGPRTNSPRQSSRPMERSGQRRSH